MITSGMSRGLCAAVLSGLFVATSSAQSHPPGVFDRAVRARVVAEIREKILAYYVFPEKRGQLVGTIDAAASHDGLAADTPSAFADKVTDVMQGAVSDRHLRLTYDPNWVATFRTVEADPAADDFDRESIRNHYGIHGTEHLLGNIRYVKISGFGWVNDRTGQAYDDVARFLKEGDAIIIDVRRNTGGAHDAVRYLISHFLDPGTKLYDFVSTRSPGSSSYALTNLPAGRIKGKPVFVLIDRGTVSAGEDLAYQVEQYRVGTLVGTTTAGAANNNEFFPVAGEYRFSLSVGRPIHPVSQTNWEGKGIEPTLPCPSHEALDRAILSALERLAANPSATPILKSEYAWARQDAESRLNPVSMPATQLAGYAGNYGVYRVVFRGAELWLEREGRDPVALSPIGRDGLFAMKGIPYLRARFSPNELTTEMLGAPDTLRYARVR